jgi:magnesium-transporting ATPase (P-type)
MKDSTSIDDRRLKDWLDRKCSFEQVSNEMIQSGIKEEEIKDILSAYKKYQSDRRQKPGFICMSAGAFIGFLSCVLTMTDLLPALTGFFLYGLTTIAICVVLYGCYLVFE